MKSLKLGWTVLAALGLVAVASAAEMTTQDRIAAVEANLKSSMASIKQYEWIETSTISMGGEDKGSSQNRCYYDATGKLVKVATGTPPPAKGGLRGKAAANKKEEIAASMKAAAALMHAYLPPDPAKIQAAKDGGRLALRPTDATGRTGVDIKDYLKPGDQLSIDMDSNTNRVLKVAVSSYTTAKDKDAVDMVASFETLPDGTGHAAKTTFDLKSAGVIVKVDNSGYKKSSPAVN
jgi:hypothetical protein